METLTPPQPRHVLFLSDPPKHTIREHTSHSRASVSLNTPVNDASLTLSILFHSQLSRYIEELRDGRLLGASELSLFHRVQIGSGARTAYATGTGGSLS
jgi:hypothetical protein